MALLAQQFTLISFKGLIVLCTSIVVLCFTVELIRRRKLRESYSLFWLLFSILFLIVSLVPWIVNWLSELTGIYYLTLMGLGVFLFFLSILMQFSVILSHHSSIICRLTQTIALQEQQIQKLEQKASQQNPRSNS